MVLIIFKLDNNGNDNRGEDVKVAYDCTDTSKTIREMLIDFVQKNNSLLKIAGDDIAKFEDSISEQLLIFMFKNRILNKKENAKKTVSQMFRTNNNTVLVIDVGNILGGNEKYKIP